MTIVVKIGGAAVEDATVLHTCAQSIAELARKGQRVAIVHGGGKTLSRTLQHMGIKTEFVDGLRVTDASTRDVAMMVLAGLVNKKIVAALQAAGVSALGLCGGDGNMFRARKKRVLDRDLGFVGEIETVDTKWLEAIWEQGGVPVLASLALGEDGEYYNINADEMASACAVACSATVLIFLTDVAGVKDASGCVMPQLRTDDIPSLVEKSVIAGGMLPKLQACARALQQGVGRVRILAAAQAGILPQLHLGENEIGTEVTCGDLRRPGAAKKGVTLEYSTAK